MFEQLKEMNAELEQLKAKHLEKSKAMFTDVAKQLFEKHAVLQSFRWTQYTPYFNDGDECVFSARVDQPDMNGMDYYDDELYEKLTDSQGNPRKNFDENINNAYKDVQEFLSNIDESILRDMFGDHVEVNVTRTGTEVEVYEHD